MYVHRASADCPLPGCSLDTDIQSLASKGYLASHHDHPHFRKCSSPSVCHRRESRK